MKAPRKQAKATAPPPPPKTDEEALVDIVAWSADRPAWQRQALRQLLGKKELSPSEIDDLYNVISAGTGASAPLTDADVRSTKAQSLAVTLKSVGQPHDVNALASDQWLTFERAGLTVVYGDNGAGKSGYARILKHACRARIDPKALSILPNVDTQAPGIPRAKLTFVVNGQNRQCDWQLDKPSQPELSAIGVFDSRTANVHVDGTNDVAYVPFSLELLRRLAKAAEALRSKVVTARAALIAQTPEALKAPPIDKATATAQAIAALAHDTEVKALEKLSLLSSEEQAKLTNLKRDLSADPATAAKTASAASAGLRRFATSLDTLALAAAPSTSVELASLLAKRNATRSAADAAAKNRFASDPLPNVGSDAWRELWEAARRYATTDARPTSPFPPSDASDNCPLCQQQLSYESVDRFARFEKFIRDDTRQQAERAAALYDEKLAQVQSVLPPLAQLKTQLRYFRDTLRDEKVFRAAADCCIAARRQIVRIVRRHGEAGFKVEPVNSEYAKAAINALSDALAARAQALGNDAGSSERKALLREQSELEARSWLATMMPDVKAELIRKKDSIALDRALAETDTRAITLKAAQLAERLVTDALRAQFSKEIASLGVSHLAVELKKEASLSGTPRFRVRLVRKPTFEVGAVLSEGEHRCVALAAFMAELATSGSRSAIIFDDPVSSLDHRHRSEVAARLAAEAHVRQVIVMTHDVAFLMLLNQAAQEAQVHVGYRCIARGVDQTGFCSHEPPFNARAIDDVLAAIETNLSNKKIHYERGNQAEWRNTIRGSLEQLRETWERAVEEFVGPVLKRLVHKVATANLAKLTVLEIADCDAMRESFGRCSELLHSVGESLNPRLPSPADIQAEIDQLRKWHDELRQRQAKVKTG